MLARCGGVDMFNQTMLNNKSFPANSFDNYHNEQMQHIMEMRKAIDGYCRAARKVKKIINRLH